MKKTKTNNLFTFKPVKLKQSFIAKPRKARMKNLIFGYDRPKPARKVTGKLGMNWTQAKRKFPKMSPMGDADKDGIQNWLDCSPFDKTRQGRSKAWTAQIEKRLKGIIPTEAEERRRIRKPKFKRSLERKQKQVTTILQHVKGKQNPKYGGGKTDWTTYVLDNNLVMDIKPEYLEGGAPVLRQGISKDYEWSRRVNAGVILDSKKVREGYTKRAKELEKRKKDYIKEHGEENYNKGIQGRNRRKDVIRHFQKFPQDLAAAEQLTKIKIKDTLRDAHGTYEPSLNKIELKGVDENKLGGAAGTISHEIEHKKQEIEGLAEELYESGYHKTGQKKRWKDRPEEIDVLRRLKLKKDIRTNPNESAGALVELNLNKEEDLNREMEREANKTDQEKHEEEVSNLIESGRRKNDVKVKLDLNNEVDEPFETTIKNEEDDYLDLTKPTNEEKNNE